MAIQRIVAHVELAALKPGIQGLACLIQNLAGEHAAMPLGGGRAPRLFRTTKQDVP